jgi:uncharacterized protein (TIGR03437 family)
MKSIHETLRTSCLVCAAIAGLIPFPSLAASYTFDKIYVKTSIDTITGAIAINNDGAVAFTASRASGNSPINQEVFLGKAGATPVNLTKAFKDFSASILIGGLNDKGEVVFIGSAGTPVLLYTVSQTAGPTLLATSDDPDVGYFLSSVASNPSINNNGDVVYSVSNKILGFSGGKTRTILDNVPYSPLGVTIKGLGNVNSNGVIALFDINKSSVPGIYAVTDNAKTVYVEQANLNYFNGNLPSINDRGTIAFANVSPDLSKVDVVTITSSGMKSIFTGTNFSLLAPPSINNNGDVLITLTNELFVGSDPVGGKVIATGDPLFGSKLIGLPGFNAHSAARTINDKGQVAFRYQLASGEAGIAIATPSGSAAITTNGVQSAGAFGTFPSIAPGSWIEIYGSNLAATQRGWAGGDFVNGTAPTTLDGVKVTVAGQPAFIDYVSPTQVNALLPSNLPLGSQQLVLTTASGSTLTSQVTIDAVDPGILAPPAFVVNGTQYAAALFADGSTFALPQAAIAGVPSRPAKPGDTLVLYGIGFGAVSGGLTAGTVVTQSNSLLAPFEVDIAGVPAQVAYFGLAPGFTGLYQFNVTVPQVADSNAAPLTFKLNGVAGSQKLYIAVHQ